MNKPSGTQCSAAVTRRLRRGMFSETRMNKPISLLVALSFAMGGSSCDKNTTAPPKTDLTTAPVPPPPPPPPPPVEVLAWVLPYENSLVSLQRNAKYLTIVSPTYFRLAVDDKAKTAKLENWDPGAPFPRQRLPGLLGAATPGVYPLVGCIGPCGPKISRVLDDEAARKAHVADLLRQTKEESLAGLVIDYEDIDAQEPAVTAFVDELSKGLHANKKKLVLVVQEPCGADPSCKRSPYPFALKTLIPMVDQLAVMEYDFVVDGSAPPAPKSWVDRGLKKVMAEVGTGNDRYKVICAVPFYGRVTKGITDDTAVLFDEVKPTSVRATKATVGAFAWDPEAFAKVANVTAGTGPKAKSGKVFIEDRETIAARIAHVQSLSLGGIAIWRLGGEDPCITPELAKFRKQPVPTCP